MKKAGLADRRISNGLPSASDPETEADRTPRGSLLACMTANREPSNQSFEIDREATVCTASRRFLPFERTPPRLLFRSQTGDKFDGFAGHTITPAKGMYRRWAAR